MLYAVWTVQTATPSKSMLNMFLSMSVRPSCLTDAARHGQRCSIASPAAAMQVSGLVASLAVRTAAFRASACMLSTFLSRSPRPCMMQAIRRSASLFVCTFMDLHTA